MNERIKELAKQSGGEFWQRIESDGVLNKEAYVTFDPPQSLEKFAELIVAECMEQVEQAKNSPFVSLDDAKRMSHFVDVTTKKITKHFGVDE